MADDARAELVDGAPSDPFYDAKVKVLSEEIEHHVQEEEMRVEGIFAQARGIYGSTHDYARATYDELRRLGIHDRALGRLLAYAAADGAAQ